MLESPPHCPQLRCHSSFDMSRLASAAAAPFWSQLINLDTILDDRFDEIGSDGTDHFVAGFLVCVWLNEEWRHGEVAASGRVGADR